MLSHYPFHRFRLGQLVYVTERSFSGKLLPREWYGEIIKLHTGGTIANVTDTNPDSPYFGQHSLVWSST
jgi:hypothetical protein